jgi:hypothetical protein
MQNTTELWPKAEYYQQVERLHNLIGQPLYIVEINSTAINAGVRFSSQPLTLLAIVDYPEPDPYHQLCPHLLVVNDGRGINLGRIARITLNTPFVASADDLVFINQDFVDNVLLAPRTLSKAFIRQTSQLLLAQLFGDVSGKLLTEASLEESSSSR